MDYTFNSVFSSATFPEYTYVNRESTNGFTYEERLRIALQQKGYMIVIDGPSKIGKTVLCEAVIGKKQLVKLSGNDFKGSQDFWKVVARRAEIPMDGEIENSNAFHSTDEESKYVYKEKYITNKERVIRYFTDNQKVLLLDDFHYADEEMQYDAACQLKEAIRDNLKVIIVSLPNRVDETVKNNPDLQGRIMNITMQPWKNRELAQIPEIGFDKLNVQCSAELIDFLVQECLFSPQTMQSICENIGLFMNGSNVVKAEDIRKSCYLRADYLTYQELYGKLVAGPSSRGQKRTLYNLTDGRSVDRYGLVLGALAKNPPLISITINEIFERAKEMLDATQDKTKLTTQNVTNTIKAMFDILRDSKYEADKVFDLKENVLTFREPLFLFYLRWRRDE